MMFFWRDGLPKLCDSNQPMIFEHLNNCTALSQYEGIVKKFWRARELILT